MGSRRDYRAEEIGRLVSARRTWLKCSGDGGGNDKLEFGLAAFSKVRSSGNGTVISPLPHGSISLRDPEGIEAGGKGSLD